MPSRRLDITLDFGITLDGRPVPPRPLGALLENGARLHFAYDATFIALPLPVSPHVLPVRAGVHAHHERAFDYVPGLIADSLPDGWGKTVQDRSFSGLGVPRERINAVDRLAAIGAAGMGALTFTPAAPLDPDDGSTVWPLDLDALAAQAGRVLSGSAEELLPALRAAGGSPGGARPKVLAGLRESGCGAIDLIAGVTPATVTGRAPALPSEYVPYLVKFGTQDDVRLYGRDAGAVEEAYARMARAAGLEVPETRLLHAGDGERHFAIRRFDRHGAGGVGRLHMHTLAGLLHASHQEPSLDYEAFVQATKWLTRDHVATVEAFRRAVFNVLAHNRDDHTKNFAYLMDSAGRWRLAPAYDLTFSTGPNGHHTTSVAGESLAPTETHLASVAEAGGVHPREGREVLEQVGDAVGRWPEFAGEVNVASTVSQRFTETFNRVRRDVLPTSTARRARARHRRS
ncbi:type II toxin-antitoxin system HipA family toxin [Gemmatimonas sp.]|uniref:type II toxin-antitoxin system HipA family toxin n=1 Tax=Gemmatimonas sp. TaxID=1962908 RepID=UPI00356234F1